MNWFSSPPPDDCELSLRMQDETSKYPVEIANSSHDPADASALIRFYNLVDQVSPSLINLVNDFLDS